MPGQVANGAEQAQEASASPEQRMAALFKAEQESATPETPETATQEQQTTESADEQTTEQTAEDAESDGFVELELDGETYRVPPKLAALKEGSLRQEDYTRKTQDLADLRKQVTLQAETQRQATEFRAATEKEHNELQSVTNQIELYKKLDWSAMDTNTMVVRRNELEMLKDQATDLQKGLDRKGKEFEHAINKRQSEMAANAYSYLGKHVQGWTPDSDIEKAIAKYVDAAGLPIDAFRNGTLAYPGVGVMAYKAMKFDELQASKGSTIAKVKSVAAPVVKPGAQTGQNAAVTKKYTEARASLRKSGSLEDAARLFVIRGVK